MVELLKISGSVSCTGVFTKLRIFVERKKFRMGTGDGFHFIYFIKRLKLYLGTNAQIFPLDFYMRNELSYSEAVS